MIYVIAVPRFVRRVSTDDLKAGKWEDIRTEACIKIGFTKNFYRRQLTYLTNTPRYDILYQFPEGTDVDEYRLHQYFDKFRNGKGLNGNEWFIWNKEIIDFFENNTTIDQIRARLDEKQTPIPKREQERRCLVKPVLRRISDVIICMNLTKEILPPNQVPQRSFGFDFSDIVADYLSQFNDSEKEAIDYLQRKLIDPDFDLFKQNYDKALEIRQKGGNGYCDFLVGLKKKHIDNTPEISGYKGTVKSEEVEDWVRDKIIEAGDDD